MYNESFVLDKPLSLIGAGPERVLLVSTAQTVIEVTPHVKHVLVSNMEIKVHSLVELSCLFVFMSNKCHCLESFHCLHTCPLVLSFCIVFNVV